MEKKILVCGVANSGNLGDRIIAESMNFIIKNTDDQYNLVNFDFTNGVVNKTYQTSEIKLNSNSYLKKLIPDFLRRLKVYKKFKYNNDLKCALSKSIEESDYIIIGGGHLLIDNYLTFPIGINNIVREARKKNKPVIIAFVGAKGSWSIIAKKMFLESLKYASLISVRDSDSKEFLTFIDPNLKNKIVSISDPALFVKDMYKGDYIASKTKRIGLGVMDPNEIKRHSHVNWNREDSANWWSTIAKRFVDLGYSVTIFTNGAPTDNGFVEYYIKKQLGNVQGVTFSYYPESYLDIIKTVNEQDCIVAQRLHACLPSISFMKPTFGVKWDVKLESIFKELDLEDNLIDFNDNVEHTILKINKMLNRNKTLNQRTIKIITDKKKEMLSFVKRGLKN